MLSFLTAKCFLNPCDVFDTAYFFQKSRCGNSVESEAIQVNYSFCILVITEDSHNSNESVAYSNAALEDRPEPVGTLDTMAALKAKFSGMSFRY